MDEKYTAFSQNLSLDNHCLSGISPFFFSFAREERFLLWKYCMRQKEQLPFMPLPVLLKCSPSNISAAIELRCFAQATRSHAAACGIIDGTDEPKMF